MSSTSSPNISASPEDSWWVRSRGRKSYMPLVRSAAILTVLCLALFAIFRTPASPDVESNAPAVNDNPSAQFVQAADSQEGTGEAQTSEPEPQSTSTTTTPPTTVPPNTAPPSTAPSTTVPPARTATTVIQRIVRPTTPPTTAAPPPTTPTTIPPGVIVDLPNP